mgnify:CR=1 FL=1
MFLDLPYIFWLQMTLLFLPIILAGAAAVILLIRVHLQKITQGAFHIENGILFTHDIEAELERFRQKLFNSGYDINGADKWRE